MGLWRPSHEDTPMTSRSARTLSLWIAVVVTGGPVHAGQERSVGDNQPWQIAGLIPESEPGPLEKQAKPGGLMRTNIPSFRLPEKVLDDEVDVILNMGVGFGATDAGNTLVYKMRFGWMFGK